MIDQSAGAPRLVMDGPAPVTRVEMSVRTLVEFLLRSGSIDQRYGGKNRMLEGSELHRKIQKEDQRKKKSYQSEVFLKGEIVSDDLCFALNGRADAMFKDHGEQVIEELKSTTRRPEEIEAKEVHRAQLFLYGLLYLNETGKDEVTLQLTYVHLESEERKSFTYHENRESLRAYAERLFEQYRAWAELDREWRMKRSTSTKELGFVFDSFRTGQREMNLAIWNTLARGHHLFLQAPTGIGKTISSLFPSVKKLDDPFERIFYLTARTSTQKEAQKAVDLMREKGLHLRSVVLTAKDKICPNLKDGRRQCDPDHCPYAKEYFDRINPVLFRMLHEEENFSRQTIEEYAARHTLCPFELSLDLASFADLIIGDYNYVFDLNAGLIRFEDSVRNIYLIDEAHNLPDRSRAMFSAELNDFLFEKLEKSAKRTVYGGKIRKACEKILGRFDEYETKSGEETDEVFEEEPGRLLIALQELVFASDGWHRTIEKKKKKGEAIESFRSVLSDAVLEARRFLQISDYYGPNYRTKFEKRPSGRKIRLICLDASEMIGERIRESGSAIFFSATLTPFSYYKVTLGMDTKTPELSLPSSFPPGNRLVLADPTVSTRFKDREDSLYEISEDILQVILQRSGNYMVFFPSYAYLRQLKSRLEERLIFLGREKQIEILEQNPEMDPEERAAFLQAFESVPEEGRWQVGLCVMGGAFSEGIDLPGEKLIGSLIVSPGIPAITKERECLRSYFEEKIGAGYDYAYIYPGMNKVLQAAGRVIRTSHDQGVIFFMDDRLSSLRYQDLYPEHLRTRKYVYTPEEAGQACRSFWRRNGRE